ncbi:MAG: 23S rRNA (adenine(2503)-C(2))-methyltransferase RlmN [Bacteroidales bacterium]|jgi:23S rRNA (adenine2503-C2)-methyltransferase|nr:23S rRNA (adenine(2503)-C(2))-methyltransferase RlmN [Bacteroidales bacterium]
MNSLYGKTLDELIEICNAEALPKFTAKQIADWLYSKQVSDISKMTNLSVNARDRLIKRYIIGAEEPVQCMESKDGTLKYLFRFAEEAFAEAVLIFDKARTTLCISSQAGCRMNCGFCATGQNGFNRNLGSGEILSMFRAVKENYDITNIVYMGMGEPLDNWEEVLKSIEILTCEWGYGISPRRITVSTCGILPKMKSLLDNTQCNIAISLHNADSNLRSRIMPVEKAYKISDIICLLRKYNWHGQRRLTFEYIVFDGLNDGTKDVSNLYQLLRGIKCRINLIKYHKTEAKHSFKASKADSMIRFQNMLNAKGLMTKIRSSKGEDIAAACGTLAAKKENITNFASR